jgi:hypothetical protein
MIDILMNKYTINFEYIEKYFLNKYNNIININIVLYKNDNTYKRNNLHRIIDAEMNLIFIEF